MSISVQAQVVETSHRQCFFEDKINCSTMVYSLAEKLLQQTLVVRAVQTWGTCHHSGLLQLQGFFELPSCQLLPLILHFAQDLESVLCPEFRLGHLELAEHFALTG